VRPAREILRDYLARRQAEDPLRTTASAQEENLRRLLRHVGAARQPSKQLETRLLDAMPRTAREAPAPPRPVHPWPWLSTHVWRFAVPAAAAALVLLTLLWPRLIRTGERVRVAGQTGPIRPAPDRRIREVRLPDRLTPTTEAEPIGFVVLPQGELLRRPARGGDWQPIEGGDPVYLGDSLRTQHASIGSVIFQDGSDCEFAPETTLQYDGTGAGLKRPSQVRLTRGELWLRVEKGGPEFRVVAPAATAVVQGTVFSVAVDDRGDTSLQVTEGKVRLQNARSAVLVHAGRESLARVGGSPSAPVLIRHIRKPRPVEDPEPPRTPPTVRRVTTPPDAHKPGDGTGIVAREKPSRNDSPGAHTPEKPASEDGSKEPAPAPINSSGAASEPETRLPMATSGP
jgi:hypothetical protein